MTTDKDLNRTKEEGGEQERKVIFIRRDGAGGITVSIPLAIIMAVFTLLGAVIPVAMAYGALNQRVSGLEQEYSAAGPVHTAIINDLDTRVTDLEKNAAGDMVALAQLQKDINEIKSDVKEVKRDLQNHMINIESQPEGGG